MIAEIKTRSEQRLAQLEALRRPLTDGESAELRRCLHAIYQRQWKAAKIEREMHGEAMAEYRIEPEARMRAEIDGIADRMIEAHDDDWPLPKADSWQEHAREASAKLRDAILRVHAKQRESVAA